MPEPAPTDDEIVKTLEIFRLPPGGAGLVVTALSHLPPSIALTWQSTYSTGTFDDIITIAIQKINALSDAGLRRWRFFLDTWDEVTPTDPMALSTGGGGEQGRVIDNDMERENIRQAVSNLIGLWVPPGGFSGDVARNYTYVTSNGQGAGRTNTGGRGNMGDR